MPTFTISRSISDETLNKIIQIESAGKPNARPPAGSAAGLFQFLRGTWIDTCKKHRPDLLKGRSTAEVEAMRLGEATTSLQCELGARFTEDNARGLGPGWKEGDLYLAHFLGLGDARKVFRADPSTPIDQIVGDKVIQNNPFLRGWTAGQTRAWAEKSMQDKWVKAGKPDWVSKWYKGVPIAPSKPDTPIKDAVKDAVKTGAGGGAAGGAPAVADPTNWVLYVGVAVGVAIVVALATFAVSYGYRRWKANREPQAPSSLEIAAEEAAAAAQAHAGGLRATAEAIAALAERKKSPPTMQAPPAEPPPSVMLEPPGAYPILSKKEDKS